MHDKIYQIVNKYKDFWPLSVRAIHYRLLNDPPLRNSKKLGSLYKNDLKSCRDLCDLCTKARIENKDLFRAISDETRPHLSYEGWDSAAPFIRSSLDSFLVNYRRDLLQGQDDHIVVIAEKNTVKNNLEPVCKRYCVPMLVARGYPDIGSRHWLVKNFEKSGKRRLVILFITDHDPEGIDITHSFNQSLCEDFGIDEANVLPKRVALTYADALRLGLSPNTAKESSARKNSYLCRTGSKGCWELESLEPAHLQKLLGEAIESCLDMEKFTSQTESEKKECIELQAQAVCVKEFLGKQHYRSRSVIDEVAQ